MKIGLVDKPTHIAAVETFEKILASGMQPANLHRLLANSPQIFAKFVGFAHALRFDSGLDPKERELAILRVLEKSAGHYELALHRPIALRAGLTQLQVDALARHATDLAGVFDERQKAILYFADAFAAGEAIAPALATLIERYFDDRLVVELAATMALYVGLAHLTAALELPLDQR